MKALGDVQLDQNGIATGFRRVKFAEAADGTALSSFDSRTV